MLPVEKYEMWEVCLFEGPDEATVNVFQDPRFFDIHSPNWATVGAYILTADVQVLYERLWEMTVLGD
jgi:hypothetical protein